MRVLEPPFLDTIPSSDLQRAFHFTVLSPNWLAFVIEGMGANVCFLIAFLWGGWKSVNFCVVSEFESYLLGELRRLSEGCSSGMARHPAGSCAVPHKCSKVSMTSCSSCEAHQLIKYYIHVF